MINFNDYKRAYTKFVTTLIKYSRHKFKNEKAVINLAFMSDIENH